MGPYRIPRRRGLVGRDRGRSRRKGREGNVPHTTHARFGKKRPGPKSAKAKGGERTASPTTRAPMRGLPCLAGIPLRYPPYVGCIRTIPGAATLCASPFFRARTPYTHPSRVQECLLQSPPSSGFAAAAPESSTPTYRRPFPRFLVTRPAKLPPLWAESPKLHYTMPSYVNFTDK
ncbi:hypothetical protein BV22DRAFT_576464 [Leucogyrophana mollusca]|uniref:Uncharacterized protein n=1 Tax=Leucogyrophana mollusca TaxID=85980 RepID=A0ACB8BCG6_9AGAM|nr:hypothetical protein BV22DRAFT_576464 [Leucogyrophana mollusca]